MQGSTTEHQILRTMFPTLKGKWGTLNLEEIARDLMALLGLSDKSPNPFLNPHYCEAWKNFLLKVQGTDYAWGGYMEDRSAVWRGSYLEAGSAHHVGVDYYVPLGTPVYIPRRAKLIHSIVDQDQEGGWGGKLTFEWEGGYFLMAHLDGIVTDVGRMYENEQVAIVGGPEVNGGWSPHLHLQCMREPWFEVDGYMKLYEGVEDDFPDPMTFDWNDF